ncbi:MAG: hypothetical protein JOZ38_06185, partial [Candidatus Eremiobacteraeota bacterium]|nr:hypothetical protein [Candidatus Eremiobacteraeota bacterium]
YELYNSTGTKLKTIAAPAAENFGYNASTNQIFSGQYSNQTTIDLDDVASATRYSLSPTPADLSEPDSNGVDQSTNIGITPNEFTNGSTATLFMVNLNGISLNSPSAGMFTGTVGEVPLTSSLGGTCDTLISDLSVDSVAHLVFFFGEFCSQIGVGQMPTSSGAPLTMSNYVFANLPQLPSDAGTWSGAGDPHAIATFNLAPVCSDCAAMFDATRSWVAIIDLNKLLAAPRDTTDTHLVSASYDLVGNGVVTYIPAM